MRAGDRVTFPHTFKDGYVATIKATVLTVVGGVATIACEHTVAEVDPAILTVAEAYPIGKKFDPWRFLATGER